MFGHIRRRILYALTGLLRVRLVSPGGDPYLERYLLLQTRWFHVYVHRFVASDPDRGYHSHPWSSRSLMLVGGYIETRLVSLTPTTRTVHPGQTVGIGPNTFHIVKLIEHDAWTLLVRGPRGNRWGFLNLTKREVLPPNEVPVEDADCSGVVETYLFAEAEDTSDLDDAYWGAFPLGRNAERLPIYFDRAGAYYCSRPTEHIIPHSSEETRP
jgi:hypothetical protein